MTYGGPAGRPDAGRGTALWHIAADGSCDPTGLKAPDRPMTVRNMVREPPLAAGPT